MSKISYQIHIAKNMLNLYHFYYYQSYRISFKHRAQNIHQFLVYQRSILDKVYFIYFCQFSQRKYVHNIREIVFWQYAFGSNTIMVTNIFGQAAWKLHMRYKSMQLEYIMFYILNNAFVCVSSLFVSFSSYCCLLACVRIPVIDG